MNDFPRDHVFSKEEADKLRAEILDLEAQVAELGQSESTAAQQGDITREITKLQSLCAPINRIPVEILGEIFYQCVAPMMDENCNWFTIAGYGDTIASPIRAPMLLTRVCWRWRSVAFATQALWTHLTITDLTFTRHDPTPAILMWFENSGTVDLNLSFLDHGRSLLLGPEDKFCRVIKRAKQELYHCSCIRVSSLGAHVSSMLFSPALYLPRLRHLAIDTERTTKVVIHAPNLSTLYTQFDVWDDQFTSSIPISANLRKLNFDRGFIEIPQFLKSISSFPELRHLYLSATTLFSIRQPNVMVTLEHLEVFRLSIKMNSSQDIPLLGRLHLPSLHSLSLSSSSPWFEESAIIPSGCSQSLKFLKLSGFYFTEVAPMLLSLYKLQKLHIIYCVSAVGTLLSLATPSGSGKLPCPQLREIMIYPFLETLVQPMLDLVKLRGFDNTGKATNDAIQVGGESNSCSLEVIRLCVLDFTENMRRLEEIGVELERVGLK